MLSKNTKLGIITFFISLTIVLVLGEWLYRAYFLTTIRYWGEFVPDQQVAWKLNPNHTFDVEWIAGVKQTIAANEVGLRDTLNPPQIDHSQPVVMVQGDSNILGYGIQSAELVTNLIQQKLKADNINVQMVNGGTSGYDLQHYVFQMEALAKLYQPNYNFIFFNLNNDYLSTLLSTSYSYSRPYYDLEQGELVLKPREFRVQAQGYGLRFIQSFASYQQEILDPFWAMKKKPALYGLWAQSYLAYGLYSRLIGYEFFKNILERKIPPFDEATTNHSLLRINYFMFDSKWSEPFATGQKLIEKLFESYKKYPQVKTVVVLFPPRSEIIDHQQVIDEVKRLSQGQMTPDFDIEYQVILDSLNKLGIPSINVRKEFLAYPDQNALYFKNNEHITPIGHEILARAIANYLSQESKSWPTK